MSVFRSLVDFLRREAWSTAAVYCIDCQFAGDPTKFIAGSLQACAFARIASSPRDACGLPLSAQEAQPAVFSTH